MIKGPLKKLKKRLIILKLYKNKGKTYPNLRDTMKVRNAQL